MKPISINRAILIGLPILLFSGAAMAAGLPWEKPLETLQKSLTGPIAQSIGILAMAVSGGMLAFGGELGDFTKRIMMVVLALGVMMFAATFVTSLGFPAAGS
ncbi:TrbC/VirB2 family protein [Parachitinimonas caeni]|uniref:TrbC/VirB2 family protein n=1 Tax=Parachitinimonas caeni TaxID=3031301 RepID=A0ABT7E5B3_9NEIS|nr:TrbC/VirB2 family protein [Parachitinimonas caeni]MDK2126640.1 TrbC/VirB2 family protein [Parachitinimonas caeni]